MARKGSGKVKTRVIKSAPKAGNTSVVVVEPTSPAAPKKRRGGGRRKASTSRRGGRRRTSAMRARARSFISGGSKAAVSAWTASQPQLLTVGAAGAIGLLQKQGIKVPKLISSLSTPANIGIAAWVAARFLKSPILDHAATGMLSVAAFGLGSGMPVGEDDYAAGSAVIYDTSGDLDGYDTDGDDLEGDDE